MSTAQTGIDRRNAAFWDELCGSGLARSLGITGTGAEDLRRFDEAYMALYPYLWDYLAPDFAGKRVLEVGLGYGTLGHLIAARRASYHGADIALAPVALMRERLVGLGRPSRTLRASALALPYPEGVFDAAYSVGCLHHTGDLPAAVGEIRRVLRRGGRAVVMLYNSLSFRRLSEAPGQFLLRLLAGRDRADETGRARYDTNEKAEAAPHTAFVSTREVKRLFAGFSAVEVEKRNCDDLRIPGVGAVLPRARLLPSVGSLLGLDLYVTAVK